MPPSKIRNVCYTLNNYTCEHVTSLKAIPSTYHIMGFETGESGTPHIQGLICFKNSRSFKSVHKDLFKSHLESMRGTHKQASDYCKKDGDYFETGTLPSPGKRSDIVRIVDYLKDEYQGNATQLMTDHPESTHRFYRFLDRIAVNVQPQRTTKTKVIWIYGTTGTGKSHYAHEHYPHAYYKNLEESFWENYNGQEAIILEDLRPHHMRLSTLLRLMDKYPMQVKVKGASAQFRSEVVIVTSDRHPRDFYQDSKGQLVDRIETIIHLEGESRRKVAV